MAKISLVICLAMTNYTEFAYLVNLPNSSGELVLKKSGTRLFYIDWELHNLTLADCYGKDRSSSHGL